MHVGECRAVTVVHGDHTVREQEDVELGGVEAVGHRAVDDEVGELVELVDLRSLPEVLRVLDGERVELEVDTEELGDRAVRGGVVQVEPEEIRPRQCGEDILGGGLGLLPILRQRSLHSPSFTPTLGTGWDGWDGWDGAG